MRFSLVGYLRELTLPRVVLWCYLIWYLLVVARYFEPSPSLWFSSLGIAGIVGAGLYLSTARGGKVRVELGAWQVFRLFLMPFCVSSFAALIRGRGFVLVFHPSLLDNLLGLGSCGAFAGAVWLVKRRRSAAVGSLASPATPWPTPSRARDPSPTNR